jgi:hypothetical protein
MPEVDTVSPISEARRGEPEPWRVGGAEPAGPFRIGFILARGPIDVGGDVRILRPWGDDETWAVYVDPLYGRIAIPAWVAVRIGIITAEAAASVARPPEVVRAEAVAKANSEAESLVVERRARRRIMGDGLAGDVADSTGEFLGGALGLAAKGGAKVISAATGAVIQGTPALGWVVIGVGVVLVVSVTRARK